MHRLIALCIILDDLLYLLYAIDYVDASPPIEACGLENPDILPCIMTCRHDEPTSLISEPLGFCATNLLCIRGEISIVDLFGSLCEQNRALIGFDHLVRAYVTLLSLLFLLILVLVLIWSERGLELF